MGCSTCKQGRIQTQWLFQVFKGTDSFISTDQGILTISQRIQWESQLDINVLSVERVNQFWKDHFEFKHNSFQQIKKDVLRTFPECSFFGVKANISKFDILLRKFALYFPLVGYTQGLNFIAGFLLMCGFAQQAAFNIMIQLCSNDKILAIGLYQDGFPLNRLYCSLFWSVANKKMPKIHAKIKKIGIADEAWIFQWFISFFIYSFPIEIARIFWAYIITKKQFGMVRLALGVLYHLKKPILQLADDQWSFYQLIDNLKSLDFCSETLSIKKILIYADEISKLDIQKGLQNIENEDNNFYLEYFRCKNQNKKSRMISNFMEQHDRSRTQFFANPESHRYLRVRKQAEHLQKFQLQKYKSSLGSSRRSFSRYGSCNFKVQTTRIIKQKLQQANQSYLQSASFLFAKKQSKDRNLEKKSLIKSQFKA